MEYSYTVPAGQSGEHILVVGSSKHIPASYTLTVKVGANTVYNQFMGITLEIPDPAAKSGYLFALPVAATYRYVTDSLISSS